MQQLVLPLLAQLQLQVDIGIEMVFNGPLAVARDDEDFFDPLCRASSTMYWMTGLSTMGIISLGMALVTGKKRVP